MRPLGPIVVLSALMSAALVASAQQENISLYGGSFAVGQAVRINYYGTGTVNFRLEKVLDPANLFASLSDLHRPSIGANTKTELVKTADRTTRSNQYGEVNFGAMPAGVYAVKANANGKTVTTLAVVSNLGLVIKRADKQILAYAADRKTGEPRPANVWSLEKGLTNKMTADKDGLTKLNVTGEQPVFLANYGDSWALSESYWNTYALPQVKGYIYTDRPVYRPGQHVDFKGIVRDLNLKPITNAKLRVSVKAPDESEVFKSTLTTNEFGSFNAGLDLPNQAGIGYYSIEALLDQPSKTGQELPRVGGSFQVEAYQKPEYAVTVTAEKNRAVQGDKVKVTIDAKYLFGGAVGGGRVNYYVTKAPYYPYWQSNDEFATEDDIAERDYGSDLILREEARLNADGKFEIYVVLNKEEDGRPQSYMIQAEVEDESRRTVAGSTRIIAFPAAVNASVRTDSYVYKVGQAIKANIFTTDLNEKPISTSVKLELVKQNWNYIKGKYEFNERVVDTQNINTDKNGLFIAQFKAQAGGGYVIRAKAKDSANRVAVEENFVWVISRKNDWYWNYREMELKLDKNKYEVGDTATAIIGSPKPGTPILVTIEAGSIMRQEIVRSSDAAINYEFKITPEMSPNVFINATMLADNNIYVNEAKVRVPVKDKYLNVNIKSNKERYAPGENGKLNIQVTNSKGVGVASELALGVVDEAIYLIRPDTAMDIRGVFHGERENAVGTNSSIGFYFDSAEARAPEGLGAGPAADGRLFAQAKERDEANPTDDKVREDFRDTILWIPNLVTDASGNAIVDVKFPDNLTTWRATGRALTKSDLVGQGTTKFMTTKDLVARLALPRFLVKGDKATISGIVNNTTDKALAGSFSIDLNGLSALRSLTGQLNVTANGRASFDLPVQAWNIGTANITARAQAGNVSDALKLPLPILARGYRDSIGFASDSANYSFNVPQDTVLKTAQMRLNITPSLLDAVSPALEFLIGYPYGCSEQTMSRFLPALLARESGKVELTDSVKEQLPDMIQAGIDRLMNFQHEDGGWGFWEFDNSTLEMTSYVLYGLLKAKALGVKVDSQAIADGLAWLKDNVSDEDTSQGERARAYRVLAQAGQPDLNGMLAFARRSELEPYALAQLALALNQANRPTEAKDLLDRLKAQRIERDRGIHWEKPESDDAWYWYWDDNDIQVTAAALEALARLEPASPLIARTSAWLLTNRQGLRWVSTQDTASVIEAALALPRVQSTNAAINVKVNGQNFQAQIGQSSDLGNLKLGQNTLEVNAPAGTFYSAELTIDREPAKLSAQTSGLKVTRKYDRLVPVWNDKTKTYNYNRKPLLVGDKFQPVTVGDQILVTITVEPQNDVARYLVVSDPLPAGFRPLDERNITIPDLRYEDLDGEYDWNYWYSGREFRDERVDLYASYLEGEQVMRYVLRAETPGTFTALPTVAFLMYDPEVKGRTPAATLNVRNRGE